MALRPAYGKYGSQRHPALFSVLDFLENASPLIFALLLLKKPLLSLPSLKQFLLGEKNRPIRCLAVFLLFAAQFLNFYCFRTSESICSPQTFLTVFTGQLLLGGGLEEGGWRGYLLPCFSRKWHILLSSTAVSTDSILLGESPDLENTVAMPENTCTVQENADTAPKTAATAPQREEKPPVRDKFPVNGLLWAVLGTVIILVLYLVTNMW